MKCRGRTLLLGVLLVLGCGLGRTEKKTDLKELFYSKVANPGFHVQLGAFREDLDRQGKMAQVSFLPEEDDEEYRVKEEMHWSPIECYHYGFDFHTRLVRVRELQSEGYNRVVLMLDTKTKKNYVLKVYGDDNRYTSELLGLGCLKGPNFVSSICTLTVRLPIKVGSLQDTDDFSDVKEYIDEELSRLRQESVDKGTTSQSSDSSAAHSDVSIHLDQEYEQNVRYKFVNRPAIIMEYIDGVTANDYAYNLGLSASNIAFSHDGSAEMTKRSMEVFRAQQAEAYKKIANLLAQLFHALTQIHAVGAVYQDMKPENLLVSGDHLFMIDFDSMSKRGAPYRGTYSTTAPERWQVLKGPLHSGVDFWSFGATCAIIFANLCAGLYSKIDSRLSRVLREYSPLTLERKEDGSFHFVMMLLPSIVDRAPREFLYPFFSPDPNARRFHTKALQQKIKDMEFFKNVDWEAIEKPTWKVPSFFYDKTQGQIRSHFLAKAKRHIDEFEDNYRKMMLPQNLYKCRDKMEATDYETPPDDYGQRPRKPQLVAELVGVKINREGASLTR